MVVNHIPQLKQGDDHLTVLKRRELEWIYKLGSLKLMWLNVDYAVQVQLHMFSLSDNKQP